MRCVPSQAKGVAWPDSMAFALQLCMSCEGTSLLVHAAVLSYAIMMQCSIMMMQYTWYIMMQCRVYCLAGAPTSFSGSVELLMTHAF